ncbi:MAG: glutathione S-transferase family protein [Alphaproteobacteria bacterium]|nr:glutathione S-transferase family protein [Alphaproteobacteria bacterium]
MALPHLFIGNKNYSSWSMRPWLALKWAGIAFEETVLALGGPGYGKSQIKEILDVSPSGRVPALHVGDLVIWDSLAIAEWAAEQKADAHLWPMGANARAICRSVTAEMHSGFAALRRDASMNVRRRANTRAWPDDTRADIERIQELWTFVRREFGGAGSYLFGGRTIADAFYAPICTRFRTYGVKLDDVSQDYCDTIFLDPAFQEWERAAQAETWTIPQTDAL